jgi:hypothetical protein
MALLVCTECSGKVSSLAAQCPHCAAPVVIYHDVTCFECLECYSSSTKHCPHCGAPPSAEEIESEQLANPGSVKSHQSQLAYQETTISTVWRDHKVIVIAALVGLLFLPLACSVRSGLMESQRYHNKTFDHYAK